MDFKVTKFSDITEIIISFFINNPILGVKSWDFKDWCLVAFGGNSKKKRR